MSSPDKPSNGEKRPPPEALVVVEDNVLVAETIADGLEALGYSPVETVSTVKGALDAVRNNPIDLAVLETDVRGHSTEAVLEALDARDIAHVVASTDDRNTLPSKAPYLLKPFSFYQLKNVVTKALKQASARLPKRQH
ncbi:hypothetical protein [Rhodanobacter sp. BL-MT-08]